MNRPHTVSDACSKVAPARAMNAPTVPVAAISAACGVTNGTDGSQTLTADLQRSVITKGKFVPDSCIGQAKNENRAGDPIAMSIDANSMTVFTTIELEGDGASVGRKHTL